MRERRVVIVVWDGLRPDLVSPEVTPTLAAMAEGGTGIRNSYCAYPSETRVNATSLATGCYPGGTASSGTACTCRTLTRMALS